MRVSVLFSSSIQQPRQQPQESAEVVNVDMIQSAVPSVSTESANVVTSLGITFFCGNRPRPSCVGSDSATGVKRKLSVEIWK